MVLESPPGTQAEAIPFQGQAAHPVVPADPIQVPASQVLREVRAEAIPVQGQAVHHAVPADHQAVLPAGEDDK